MTNAQDFVDRASQTPGITRDMAYREVDALQELARAIVRDCRNKAVIFDRLDEAVFVGPRKSKFARGRYDLAATVQEEIDYLEITVDAMRVVQEEADRCIGEKVTLATVLGEPGAFR